MSESSSLIEFDGIIDLLDRFVEVWNADGYEEGAESPVGWETWKWKYQRHLRDGFLTDHEITELTAGDIQPLIEVLDEPVDLDAKIPVHMLGGGTNGGIAWRDFKEISEANPEATAETLSFFFDSDEDIEERLGAFREFYLEVNTSPGSLLALAACLLMFVYPDKYIHYKWTQMRNFFSEFAGYKVKQGFDAEQYRELNEACERLRERLQGRVADPSMLHVQTMMWSWKDLSDASVDSSEEGLIGTPEDVGYYWVNQRNPAEREHEYLRSQDTYYTRDLTKLEPGDVLFHYWEGGVRAQSIVQNKAYEVSGEELENSEDDQTYWNVDVDLRPLDPVRDIQKVAPVLQREDIKQGKEKYAINPTGVQSWYLCNLTAAAADYLLNLYPEEPDPPESTDTRYFWVNAEATDWHQEGGESFYQITNPAGKTRRNQEAYQKARPGDEVLVYQISPAKQIVGRAHVSHELHEESPTVGNDDPVKGITLRWDESIDGAKWRSVKTDPEMTESQLVESDNSFVITELTEREYERILELSTVSRFQDFVKELAVPESEITVERERLYFPDEEWERIRSRVTQALANGNHVLLFGPPGTGKTKLARQVCEATVGDDQYELVTASADWSTFDTVGGYQTTSENTLEFQPGVVLDRFQEDGDGTPANEWLVIDELNRADIDKAFGSLFSVLTGESVTLPFDGSDGDSVQILDASRDREEVASNRFYVPADWRMLATMNTLDKTSLYEMSYAFMRRWAFVPVGIPELPDRDDGDDSELEALVADYVSVWSADGEVPETEQHYETVGRIWRAVNEERAIGPAIVEDIYEHVAAAPSPEAADYVSPVIMYVFPQLEGLRRNEIERLIGRLDAIVDDDTDELWTVARDFFQADLQPSSEG